MGEMRKCQSQRTPKTTTGRVFSSNHTTPGLSFAAALRTNTEEQQRPHPSQTADAAPVALQQTRAPPVLKNRPQQTGQSVQAPNVNSSSLDNMFKDASVVQQIMTGLSDAVSEEQKIVAITKIVMKLMHYNGC
jgi:hypothetical protein